MFSQGRPKIIYSCGIEVTSEFDTLLNEKYLFIVRHVQYDCGIESHTRKVCVCVCVCVCACVCA